LYRLVRAVFFFSQRLEIRAALAGYRKHKRRRGYHSRRFFGRCKADEEEENVRIIVSTMHGNHGISFAFNRLTFAA
jgi:hypothetical protein